MKKAQLQRLLKEDEQLLAFVRYYSTTLKARRSIIDSADALGIAGVQCGVECFSSQPYVVALSDIVRKLSALACELKLEIMQAYGVNNQDIDTLINYAVNPLMEKTNALKFAHQQGKKAISPGDSEVPKGYVSKLHPETTAMDDEWRTYRPKGHESEIEKKTLEDPGQQLKVPSEIFATIDTCVSGLKKEIDAVGYRDPDGAAVMSTAMDAIKEIKDYLKMKTFRGMQQAQLLLMSLTTPIQTMVPQEVINFIARGGTPESLKNTFNRLRMTEVEPWINTAADSD